MSEVLIKICGLTRVEDVQAAVDAGAGATGFVFASSPRQVNTSSARRLCAVVPAHCLKVGVFMDQPTESVLAVVKQLPLDLLQFHGSESEAYCSAFGLPWLKAVSLTSANTLRDANARWPGAAGLLCDSAGAGGAGGTGRTFNWSFARDSDIPLWLAGGLNAANISEAIRQVRPYAVDVSSGVEESPGIKSADLINAFIAAARQAGSLKNPSGKGQK